MITLEAVRKEYYRRGCSHINTGKALGLTINEVGEMLTRGKISAETAAWGDQMRLDYPEYFKP